MNAQTVTRLVKVVASAALTLMAAACSGNVPSRAGGTIDTKVTVLTMANHNDSPPTQLTAWIGQVHDLSRGSIQIDLKNSWRTGEASYETQTVHDVKQAKVDMAWVGARSIDRVGVTSFQALLAPMLVDSYDLETRVFQEGIAAEMLKGVASAGVVGVGVVPGPMRKLMGISTPFLAPADFAGRRIAYQDSSLTQMTLQTLGAVPVAVPGGQHLSGVDGYEQQLESIAGNRYDTTARFTTANLNLWPRPLVIVMGQAAWAKLPATQRNILRRAAAATLTPAIDASRHDDQAALPAICSSSMTLPTATPRQLAQLRTAVEPVYSALRHDANTKRWLDRIQALKAQLHTDPETVSCAALSKTSQPASPIDGTYSKRTSAADNLTACHGTAPSGAAPAPAHSTLEVVFNHGSVTQYEQPDGSPRDIGWRGTYQVFGDTLELTEDGAAAPFTVTWSLNGSSLTLSSLKNGHCDDVAVWSLHSWTKRK